MTRNKTRTRAGSHMREATLNQPGSAFRVSFLTLALLISAVVFTPQLAFAERRSCGETVHTLGVMFRQLRDPRAFGPSPIGQKLADAAGAAPRRCLPAIMPLLVRALRDDNDLVRNYAAEALGEIGWPARGAVPALIAALKLDKCVCEGSMCISLSWSSSLAIADATMEITGSAGDPAPFDCDHRGYVSLEHK